MSVTGVFTKGRGTGHVSATSVLRYVPRARVPWQPSRFGRENLAEDDLARLWGLGRYRTGPGNYNSGYSTEKTHSLEDNTINMIPKHELEKFMPDISLGPKALVTPVSLMSARNGHRVTHDLLHSYDPYVGRLQKPATVDHDNITVEDPNRVGLNAATLDCRGRIYRWLRRGPFFQEDHYFRRSTRVQRDGQLAVAVHEVPLMQRIVRLARRGQLKLACEEYRKTTSVPPVEVYRALTAACVPGAKLADAIAIFEDGNTRLFYAARDGEVLYNLLRCAMRAKHRVRVMWVYNVMVGRHYENVVVRAEVDPIWRYRIASLALEYLLDHNAGEEARVIYSYLAEAQLLDCDLYVRLGHVMQQALQEGKTVHARSGAWEGMALAQNAAAVAPQVVAALYARYAETMKEEGGDAVRRPGWSLADPATTKADVDATAAVAWLRSAFPDIDPIAVLRLARFRRSAKDLMAKDRPAYVQRAAQWVELLSPAHQAREEAPLTYLRKSRPSLTNANVRVAWLPERQRAHALLARDEGFQFAYAGPESRFVEETFSYGGSTLESRYLAQQPIHTEVTASVDLSGSRAEDNAADGRWPRLGPSATTPRILHASVLQQSSLSSSGGGARTTLRPGGNAAAAAASAAASGPGMASAHEAADKAFEKDHF
ncbi:putative mitochondrial hypothetical protein [Leptomonas pyrrhocoris]|uniref:Uncharacterized protein n=1 Tax=Leptomonas pyrrhocoris TaxID=157538 RepID=A0A0N0DRU3_LEPPY|nr:putative mitochondrial hypothetical protein [Leptomonas pyrrhocoris]XP_015653578.1 putative mitochondrial hypothetical protein [Leptomonas pyrrhocoris]KPA75138.1 putative mitochondrial hypothetical protein [Leptomonas pyrrhocoris]KPA75139.1 putative mitochondrial hypothetical protein [Leptomonas pyrrhocoris]|eukprot:XP_015653577.1 putative mitochondrial hypothetical protein [Leptomonas pyrrhocoris]